MKASPHEAKNQAAPEGPGRPTQGQDPAQKQPRGSHAGGGGCRGGTAAPESNPVGGTATAWATWATPQSGQGATRKATHGRPWLLRARRSLSAALSQRFPKFLAAAGPSFLSRVPRVTALTEQRVGWGSRNSSSGLTLTL